MDLVAAIYDIYFNYVFLFNDYFHTKTLLIFMMLSFSITWWINLSVPRVSTDYFGFFVYIIANKSADDFNFASFSYFI